MRVRISSARPLGLALAAAALTVGVAACGQSDPAEESAGTNAGDATSPQAPAPTADRATPTPGPGATPGCDVLTGPVFELVEISTPGDGTADSADRADSADSTDDDNDDVAAASEDVARVADGVDDNALSAVASRLSGLAVQPEVNADAVRVQWDQFRQLCDID